MKRSECAQKDIFKKESSEESWELKDLIDSRFLRSYVEIISSSMERIDAKVEESACDKEK